MGRKNNSAWTNAKCRGNRSQGRNDRANTIRKIRDGGIWGTPFKHYPIDPVGVVESLGAIVQTIDGASVTVGRVPTLSSDLSIQYNQAPLPVHPCYGDIASGIGGREFTESDNELGMVRAYSLATQMVREASGDHYSPEWYKTSDRSERIKQACEIIDYMRIVSLAFTLANNGGSTAGRTEAQWSASSIGFTTRKGTQVNIMFDPERVFDPRDMAQEVFAKVSPRSGHTIYSKAKECFETGKGWGINGWKAALSRTVYGWFRDERALKKIRREANTARGQTIQANNMADSPTLSRGVDWVNDDTLRVLSAREALSFLDGFISTLKDLADSALDSQIQFQTRREYKIATLLRTGQFTHSEIVAQCHCHDDCVQTMVGRFRLAISSDPDTRAKALSLSFGDVRYTLRDDMAGDFFEGFERKADSATKEAKAKVNAGVRPVTNAGVRSWDKAKLIDRSRKSVPVFA